MGYNYSPYWWPFTDPRRYSGSQTEVEKRARSRSIEGTQGYWSNVYGEYNSFSGADIVAYIHIPPQSLRGQDAEGIVKETEPVVGILGTLQTLSYSIHREVVPVRAIGKTAAHSYTRGPRTIAGTMVWATMDQYVLADALRFTYTDEWDPSSILIDQIPPFNIIVTFNNEYGDVSTMGLYGIRMVNEGSTFSVDDIMTEQTNTYVAGDMDLLHKGPPFRNMKTFEALRSGSQILMKEARKRMEAHRSPFL
ncbi:hypothetical protein DRQ25_11660 [Candidatus Fermentibacteria bacterium]|nr:MAG: hypothetical protein DRQ25_11660 [Candidatus Fermentibacteria bacterium]